MLKNPTLRLRPPLGRTVLVALLILVITLLILEGLARLPAVQSLLIAPSIGENHDHLAIKLQQLDQMAAAGESIECIAVGSSMIEQGFAPAAFSTGYEQTTGQPMSCYNFGLIGTGAAEAGIWAPLLAERYHPRLIIYGVSARDLSVADLQWRLGLDVFPPSVRHPPGQPSLDGWLTNHSMAYRYYLFYRFWPWNGYTARLIRLRDYQQNLEWGFRGGATDQRDITQIPDRQTNQHIYQDMSPYEMREANLDGLSNIAAVQEQGVQVIFVEMPLPDTFMYFFENGQDDYQLFLDTVSTFTADHGIPFIRSRPTLFIPDDGWMDYTHLNRTGALIFSEWLGTQVALHP